jgi:hypothetical protein
MTTERYDLVRVGLRVYTIPERDAPWARTLTTLSRESAVTYGFIDADTPRQITTTKT